MLDHFRDIETWKAGTFFVLSALFLWLVLASEPGWVPLLDGANLMFHEAGHMIYGILGPRVEPWGGTLGQLTMPLVALVVFAFQGHVVSMSVAGIWLGENFFNIARYVADARAQDLPLVGGGYHDWNHILGGMNILHKDTAIAKTLTTVGWTIILISLAWVAFIWFTRRNGPRTTIPNLAP